MNPSAHEIVIVDDEVKPAQVIAEYLQREGLRTAHLLDGLGAVAYLRQHAPSVVILDVMLPGLDGIEVCRAVRQFSMVPIIMLTARVGEADRIQGLDIGADDYLCKPVSPREIVARVRAQLRRASGTVAMAQHSHGFVVEEAAQRIRWQGKVLPLSQVEYRLFKTLLAQPGRIFEREALLNAKDLLGRAVNDRSVDSHIKNIRKKIKPYTGDTDVIFSVYGVGYRVGDG
ncbi:response regulator [Massilia antarctica]|uniref:response regulator n=1 Tax=Massilia antarctica TaxID=2765360 RepID=UPI0006BB8B51|nr:response regulator [Massilia sp. H27-R4]MCY0915223.1 response regulator [Massilia sp. H27-R4]CUI05726.1 Phosphate regulon transcriptional regulatory protein PhoB (SphR) [Janthinobacterium sp. CG23_2]CUU29512.1 Phosphate regulon transcriptional regulatory protein PhoB (SphR) [Janthinobacterium sp. CG23_2]